MNNAFVSPLTTLVANEITFNGSTLAEAREKVKSDYGINADLMVNFITQNNNDLQAKARTVATVLGAAKQGATCSSSISLKSQLEAISKAVTANSSDISQSNVLLTAIKQKSPRWFEKLYCKARPQRSLNSDSNIKNSSL